MNIPFDINSIPNSPGCYLFKNSDGDIIYIGKSKALRNRVRQYFSGMQSKKGKYAELAREIRNVDIVTTDTETNALLMECALIKKHMPRYNSQLKRSRIFPFICVNTKQEYPSITVTDSIRDDGLAYFGCFYNEEDALRTLELINSIWHTPLCLKNSFNGKHKPCLNFHINKCTAPCGGKIPQRQYAAIINDVLKCLNGRCGTVIKQLKKDMYAASIAYDFETAALKRDNIAGLNRLMKKQKSLYTNLDNISVYLFLRAFNEQCFSLLFINDGITLHRIDFPDMHIDNEALEAFISENKNITTTVSNGKLLTSHILEIGAQKLFVPVSPRARADTILKKLNSAYTEFILKN